MDLKLRRVAALQGQFRPASDKSLTHRAYMLAAIANGECVVRNPLVSEDCENTLQCLCQMGLTYDRVSSEEIHLKPSGNWHGPEGELECGNSGTTMRLLSGLIASRPIRAVLTGDESLKKRPMGRIAEPLREMGASFEGDTPPVTIQGRERLHGIDYTTAVASAQVKSCILLAGLRADEPTTVREPAQSRDHTERMLRALGANIKTQSTAGENIATIEPADRLNSFQFRVPADISSAAFFLVASCIAPSSRLRLLDVGINPTRTGILDVLTQAGVTYALEHLREELAEPVADLEVATPELLQPFEISGGLVPRLIDEIPVLAILATQCDGETVIRDAKELRVKESDRIASIAKNLQAMGAEVHTMEDGLRIGGPTDLHGAVIESEGDHRIAMAFAIAGLIAKGETIIKNAECIATSYPGFEQQLWSIIVV